MKPGLSLVPSSADPAVKRWKRIAAGATAANQDPAAYKAWWAKVVAHDSNRWAAAHHVAFQQAGHQLSPESLHRPTTGPPRVVDPEIRRIHTEGVVAAWDHPDTHRLAAERAAGRAKVEAESAENAAWEAQGVDADAREPSALRGKQVWLYHGTSDLFLSDIQTNGLRPGQVSEPSNFGTASRGNRRQSKVFLTDDPTAARNYARNAAQRQGGSPVVLRMLVAGNDLSRDRDDREIAGIGAHQYTAPEVAADRVMEVNDRRIRPLAKGITMIGFFEFSALTKAQQLALFGGHKPPTALPMKPAGPHHDVQVKAHLRATAHGMQTVAAHTRSILTASDAFRLGRKDLQKHVEAGGENGATAQAELDRRRRKREETPAIARAEEAAATATPAEVAAATTPEPAIAQDLRTEGDTVVAVPVEPMPAEPAPAVVAHPDDEPGGTWRASVGYLNPDGPGFGGRPGVAETVGLEYGPRRVDPRKANRDRQAMFRAHEEAGRHPVGNTEAVEAAPSSASPEEKIPGGEASGMAPTDFEPEQLARGTAEETEHTTDPDIAQEIAMDHLAEDPNFYEKPDAVPHGEEPSGAAAAVEDAAPAFDETEAEPIDTERRGTGEHHDVGDVLWGARKHKWKKGDRVDTSNLEEVEALGEDVARGAVTKANVFGAYDHQADRDLGDTAGASYFKARILDTIAATAVGPTERRWYVEGARWLKHELDQVHTLDDVRQFLNEWRLGIEGHMVEDGTYTVAELKDRFPGLLKTGDEIPRGIGWRGSSLFLHDHTDTTPETITYGSGEHQRTVTHNRPKEYQVSTADLKAAGYSNIVRVDRPDGVVVFKLATSAGSGVDNMFSRAAFGLGGLTAATTDRKTIRANKLIRAIMSEGATYDKHRPIARTLEKKGEAGWEDGAMHATRRAATKPGTKWARRDTPIVRVGGAPLPPVVDGDALREAFGFRGVQHGTWVDQESRTAHLQHAYGALSDLAEVVGVPTRALSHGQRLGLAFGARGNGQAGAHYEPSQATINLTHTRGAGALAHEWAHFFDHQLTANPHAMLGGGIDKVRAPNLSHRDQAHASVHPDVVRAFDEVMVAIRTGVDDPVRHDLERRVNDYNRRISQPGAGQGSDRYELMAERNKINRELQEARKVGRRGGSKFAQDASLLGTYWEAPHEMFARAFEAFVEDDLNAKGRKNTYLASGTAEPYELERTREKVTLKGLEPYPQGQERTTINGAMRRLVDAMSRHQTLAKALAAHRLSALAKAVLPDLLPPRDRPEEPDHPFAGFLEYQGVPIDVETAAGEYREGMDADGKPWRVKMPTHYGEVRGTVAADGDAVDVFVGPEAFAPFVYVVQTCDPTTKKFDEPKCMLGYLTKAEALRTFRASYNRRGMVLSVTTWPIGAWVAALARPKVAAGKMDRPLRKADLERTIHLDVSAGAA